MATFLQRGVTIALSLALMGGVLIIASIVVVVTAGIALALAGWLWWRNPSLRSPAGRRRPVVIEGEYRVERFR